jgi:hypothetical protein
MEMCAVYYPLWSDTLLAFLLSPEGAEFRERLATAIAEGIHPPVDNLREYVKTPEGAHVLETVRKLIAEGRHPPIDHLLE